MDRLLAVLSDNQAARRGLTGAAVVLLATALVLLGFPVYSNIVHNSKQGELRQQLSSSAVRQSYVAGTIKDGQSLTRITIPAIAVNVVVVQGTDEKALQSGAGHYPTSPLPCAMGDVAIAGHRTTYGKPFSNVNLLEVGDQITLTTPVGSCVYRVTQAPFSVPNTDVSVVDNTPAAHTLTLTSCTPKGSAADRIIIKAQMVSSETVA